MSITGRPLRVPPARPGRVIGLLGGSFDPPHAGHVHITREALKRFGLDSVWWLVSPGNPLKSHGPAPLERRMQAAHAIMQHPRVYISDVEAQIGARYTAHTLAVLRAELPDVHFVWLMGADNMVQFHLWQDWRQIMETVPLGILARPGARLAARASVAARIYENARVPQDQARILGRLQAPAWCFANVPMIAMSSTRLRESGKW